MRWLALLASVACGSRTTNPGVCQPSSYVQTEDPLLTGVAVVACDADDPTFNLLEGDDEGGFSLPLTPTSGEHRFFARFAEPVSDGEVNVFAGPCPFAGFTVCLPEGRASSRLEANRIVPTLAFSDENTLFASFEAPTTASQVMLEVNLCESVPSLCSPQVGVFYTVRYDAVAHPPLEPVPGAEVCRCE